MRRLATMFLVLLMAGSAFALDRADMPNNPNAVTPTIPEGAGGVIEQQRDTTVYSVLDDFLAVLNPLYFFDDFGWLSWGTIGGDLSYDFGPENGFGFTASAFNGLYSIPGALSTNTAFDDLVLDLTGTPAFAVAGNFFATDFDGITIPATTTVVLNDGTTVDLTSTSFAGFASTQQITQIVISTPDTGISAWVTVDNFYIGTADIVANEGATMGAVKALFD